jgi:nucleotide-binding universal stress UspA family protein
MLIAHTTDLSGNDDTAFEHAVALAARGGCRLASIHACVGPAPERELPQTRPLLARWDVVLDIAHERILHQCCDDPTDTLLDALRRLKPDLIVAATHARTGLDRLLAGSVAEGVARNVPSPTLLLPLDGARLVDAATGHIRLERILIPAGDTDEAEQALAASAMLVERACADGAEIVLLHVEDGRPPPDPRVPAGLRLIRRSAREPLPAAILETADAFDVSALCMVTRGHDELSDVLRGSHTERVLHQCRRPMLWVPYLNTETC